MSVVKVQVGLLGTARELQRDLNRMANNLDTSTSQGLHYLLQETVLALQRNPQYAVYGALPAAWHDFHVHSHVLACGVHSCRFRYHSILDACVRIACYGSMDDHSAFAQQDCAIQHVSVPLKPVSCIALLQVSQSCKRRVGSTMQRTSSTMSP